MLNLLISSKKPKENIMKKEIICRMAAVVLSAVLLTACGDKGGQDATAPTEAANETQTETQESDVAESAADSTVSAQTPADSMVGEWVYICTLYHSEDSEGEYDSCTMSTDEAATTSAVIIRKDGEKYLVDYNFSAYEYSEKVYGAALEYKDGTAYRDAENDKWYLEMADPFAGEDTLPHRFSLTDDGILFDSREHLLDNSEEYPYYSTDLNLYMKKGSPELDDPENLAYFDTVTVSDTTELLNSIANNRKIIVREGTYDFSDVSIDKIDSRFIEKTYGDAFEITRVSNLCIEADKNAKVLFCIDEPYDPVMSFSSGGNIRLRGITAGHNVEPGYCSGSVLYFNDISGLDIEGCSLYGSGTYGIEADYTYDINVTDTEIYECTYGLINFRHTGIANFKNCVMRDSSDLTMISIDGGYDVTFEDCKFNNNKSSNETSSFVYLGEYDNATFRKCSFSNNQFFTFSNREVTMEDCTYDSNYAAFSDLITSSDPEKALDKDTILDNYKKVLKKQDEIDSKLNSDSLMDQMTLNQTAYDEYNMWDTLLNQVWQYLGATLDEKEMEVLKEEQQKWIKEKETAMKDAGADFEGGSMQPMVEYGAGSSSTRKRTELLIGKYIQ